MQNKIGGIYMIEKDGQYKKDNIMKYKWSNKKPEILWKP